MFKFSDAVRQEVLHRQWNRCACCNLNLNRADAAHMHHVIPKQTGKRFATTQETKEFMPSAKNCVYLCEECHFEVAHNEDYWKGAVASPDAFPFSHWQNREAHKIWCTSVDRMWEEFRKIIKNSGKG